MLWKKGGSSEYEVGNVTSTAYTATTQEVKTQTPTQQTKENGAGGDCVKTFQGMGMGAAVL